MAPNTFPGMSENGIWTYDELLNSGYSAARLSRMGIIEGDQVQVQFDENEQPYVSPICDKDSYRLH